MLDQMVKDYTEHHSLLDMELCSCIVVRVTMLTHDHHYKHEIDHRAKEDGSLG